MIKLRNNPIEGSSVKLSVSFKDAFGSYYVPSSVNYSILALNSDEESWSVVDGIYEKELEPASSIAITTPPASVISGTTLTRKMLVKWTATVEGTYTDFVDEVDWVVQPKPYVPGAPAPTPTEKFVKIVSAEVVDGSFAETPLTPIFKLKANVPVSLAQATAKITDAQGSEAYCEIEIDETNTVLLITRALPLPTFREFTLTVSGLTAKMGGYGMEKDFAVDFKTLYSKPVINVVSAEFTANGNYTINAPEGYSSMRKVKVNVAIPDQIALYAYVGTNTLKTFWSNGELLESGTYKILPDGESFVDSLVDVSDSITFLYEGETETLTRDSEKDIMKK